MEEVKRRRLSTPDSPPNSSDAAQASQQNGIVDPIFLSHSRAQKDFVTKLRNALVKAGHQPFFDTVSLRGGVPLSESIERAARECKLGVVVLSKEYLTTLWPMLELEIMTADSNITILPVFYKLSPEDLKSAQSLSEWREEWDKIDGIDVDVCKWENAIESIRNQSGHVFRPNMVEDKYIENIVEAICKIIPPTIIYDLSYTKGRERLVKVVFYLP